MKLVFNVKIFEGTCSINYNKRCYTDYYLELDFDLRDGVVDKRTIKIFCFSLSTAKVNEVLDRSSEKASRVDWRALEKNKDYCEYSDIKLGKLPKKFQEFVLKTIEV